MITRAPPHASASAVARPMPAVPPVTRHVLPEMEEAKGSSCAGGENQRLRRVMAALVATSATPASVRRASSTHCGIGMRVAGAQSGGSGSGRRDGAREFQTTRTGSLGPPHWSLACYLGTRVELQLQCSPARVAAPPSRLAACTALQGPRRLCGAAQGSRGGPQRRGGRPSRSLHSACDQVRCCCARMRVHRPQSRKPQRKPSRRTLAALTGRRGAGLRPVRAARAPGTHSIADPDEECLFLANGTVDYYAVLQARGDRELIARAPCRMQVTPLTASPQVDDDAETAAIKASYRSLVKVHFRPSRTRPPHRSPLTPSAGMPPRLPRRGSRGGIPALCSKRVVTCAHSLTVPRSS